MGPNTDHQASKLDKPTTRSRTGCRTCRLNKVKCDEKKPECFRCSRLRRLCEYEVRRDRAQTAVPIRLAQFANSACSLDLTVNDHEAIRYFRTTFARLHHTKNPDFSVYSIMFTIAERDALVMHTLLALGGREMDCRRPHTQPIRSPPKTQHLNSLNHYSSALQIFSTSQVLCPNDQAVDTADLDVIWTALYLMLLYEQRYGDANCIGLRNHLNGTAMILRHRCSDLREQLDTYRHPKSPPVLSCRTNPNNQLSLYSARLLIWITLCDSAASTYGVGGSVNTALQEIMSQSDTGSSAENVERLHTFSNPLFRVMWDGVYPQAELLDDVENRSVFELMVACSQARFALAQLVHTPIEQRQACLESARLTIQYVSCRYRELLEVAGGLSPSTDSSQRLVANLRGIVPHYHAAVVLFSKLAHQELELYGQISPEAHMDAILQLARQGFRHGGDEAVMRIAWPLLVVALETENKTDADWIVARFQTMRRLSKNLERAHDFLSIYMAVRHYQAGKPNPWLEPAAWFRSTDGSLFII